MVCLGMHAFLIILDRHPLRNALLPDQDQRSTRDWGSVESLLEAVCGKVFPIQGSLPDLEALGGHHSRVMGGSCEGEFRGGFRANTGWILGGFSGDFFAVGVKLDGVSNDLIFNQSNHNDFQ
jgi:hypothetical protein